mmetsp:Transcript_30050/g.67722  ORF Transcript_30050/g.67722 Transcript_30050/m.67722 type:complete len:85 (-) Transcript_30050:48-302(-)
MQNPGEALTEIARASSVGSALWARLNKRSKGLRSNTDSIVQMDDYAGNVKLTLYNTKWFWFDNILLLSPLSAGAFVYFMHKLPK